MEPIELGDSQTGSTARIAPALGFNLYEFRAGLGERLVDVIASHPDFAAGGQRPSGNGIPILFPFPNRIRHGRFRWQDREFELPAAASAHDPMGNAIHGFCLDRPWRVVDVGEGYVVGKFQLSVDAPDRLPLWPADFRIEVRYQLAGASLRCDVRIVNPDTVPLPWGLGTHPYFRVPLAPENPTDSCLIEAPAAEEWQLIDCLPTGERTAVSPEKDLRGGARFDRLTLDDVFTGLPPTGDPWDCLVMDERAGLQVVQRADGMFRELVVFTPPKRHAICLEPYTCVTDAINLQQSGIDAGLQVLQPQQEVRTWIEIHVGPVIA